MRRRLSLSLLALLLVCACKLSSNDPAPVAGPPAPEEITVTPLDAPGAGASPAAATEAEAAAEPAAPDVGKPGKADASAAPPAAEVPVPAKSAAEISCERKGGRYVATGESGARSCIQPTRDAGKQCSKESDCDGLCLARSRTCAPFKPLFGCNDILQKDGRRVTLCID